MRMHTIAILGAGASGFFAALELKKLLPSARVCLIERTGEPLSKVRISGGGRCNVTNACLDSKKLSSSYPRGGKFLLPLFMHFQPNDMMNWLKERNVSLKIEAEGRVFPSSDSSESIISCFLEEQKSLSIEVQLNKRVERITLQEKGFILRDDKGNEEFFSSLLIATGSHPEPLSWVRALGIEIVPQAPSLFAFNCPSSPFLDRSGISLPHVTVRLLGTKVSGPILLTHFGFSGPAILTLSSLLARKLFDLSYSASFSIDWLPSLSFRELLEKVEEKKSQTPSHKILKYPVSDLPHSLWHSFLRLASIDKEAAWNDLSHQKREILLGNLKKMAFQLEGKTTNKQEFVTAGGVSLDEVDPKTLESKKIPGLFFAGEILDIDGVTGGFNLQAAWTTGYTAAHGIVKRERGV